MQVFTGDLGDYHRTRLTHTMEVSSIARTIGRALRLNEDLIEALALLHDIGHPPFGHAGEDALNECLASEGGFSHNAFALVLVEQLERRYERFPGLNLSQEVLAGQQARANKNNPPGPLLEVQVVDAADSIAYNAHDVDDALKLELVEVEQLREVPLVAAAWERVSRQGQLDRRFLRQEIVRQLIELQVSSTLRAASQFIESAQWNSWEQALTGDFRIGPEPAMASEQVGLQQFLYDHIYRHPQLLVVRAGAQRQLCEMLDVLTANPSQLPEQFRRRAESVGSRRSAADYLAGMTDRFCRQEYQRLLG